MDKFKSFKNGEKGYITAREAIYFTLQAAAVQRSSWLAEDLAERLHV